MLNKTQKSILEFVQGNLPLTLEPYLALAEKLGISTREIAAELKKMKNQGVIRRFGAILSHRKVGLSANCMCAWKVPAAKINAIAALAKEQPAISHCYLRKTARTWPYNFYTMIHGVSKKECLAVIKKLADKTGVETYQALFTLKQFKKTSPRYKV